ncbi:uncharacterized protein SCHCODRAFT_02743662 [Schizophyllum commune H4-8]|uniref:Uncharacterized protein n=1 Tax=Schizophyllum commune (strain H4-8 / FGSC 9210) TaxID=578458 RepID=D8PTY8_SCHCM|nr:uncharacterized protein SCHCODRAFT_02743662 [Schizophyllum commune H4-8]KAI5900785.1 hypothetical protein SCHCODRAFT_02743662 [Schizophyllum commune H4-8]
MATVPDDAGGPPPDGQVPERTPSPGFDPRYLEFRTPSDSPQTPEERPRYLRKKIVSIIGYAVCLFTGMMPSFYLLECMHIIPRSLHRTHWVMFFCFREAVGIMINGERNLNLDTFGNCDLGRKEFHAMLDGPSVKEGEYGQGEIALRPKNMSKEVAHIRKHWGEDYEKMYPELYYEYDIYGFLRPDKDAPFYGIFPNPDRTYGHLTKQQRADLLRELDVRIAEPSESGDALTPEDVANEKKPPCSGKGDPIPHILKAGCQGYTRRSHLKPVMAMFDYVWKIKYRLDHPELGLIKTIPEEDLAYFEDVLWPEFKDWYEPTPEIQAAMDEYVLPGKRKLRNQAVKSEPIAQPNFTGSAPAPRANTTDGVFNNNDFADAPSQPERGTRPCPTAARSNPLWNGSPPRRSVDDDFYGESAPSTPCPPPPEDGPEFGPAASSEDSDDAATPKATTVPLPAVPETLDHDGDDESDLSSLSDDESDLTSLDSDDESDTSTLTSLGSESDDDAPRTSSAADDDDSDLSSLTESALPSSASSSFTDIVPPAPESTQHATAPISEAVIAISGPSNSALSAPSSDQPSQPSRQLREHNATGKAAVKRAHEDVSVDDDDLDMPKEKKPRATKNMPKVKKSADDAEEPATTSKKGKGRA